MGRRTSQPTQKRQSRSKRSVRLWLRLLSCETTIERKLRTLFMEQFDVTLPQFDVMAELEHAGERLTMSQLSQELMVSNGNVTGVVDRLEKKGFVTRLRPSFDGRVLFIELTKEGRKEFKRIAKQHDRWQTEFFSSLSTEEMDELERLVLKIRHSVLQST